MNRAAIPASHLHWVVLYLYSDLFCPEQNQPELSAYKPSHLQSEHRSIYMSDAAPSVPPVLFRGTEASLLDSYILEEDTWKC